MATQIALAVAITATISLILAGMLFYFLYRFTLSRRLERDKLDSSFRREPETSVPRIQFRQHGNGAIKGVMVDEEGLNMLYVRKLEEGQQFPGCFSNKGWYNPMDEEVKKMNPTKEERPIQEIPLLQEPMSNGYEVEVKKPLSVNQNPQPPPPPPPCPTKVKPVPPPLPPKKSGLIASNKPLIFPRGVENKESKTKEPGEEGIKENSVQMKLKPLHWEKVRANADHSMVRNDINNGSFREPETAVPRIEFRQHGTGAIKGVIVDEEGLNMLFVRKLEEGQQFPGCFSNKDWYNPMDEEVKKMNPSKEDKPIQEIPLLQEPMRNEYEVEVKKPLSVNQNPLPPLPPPSCPTKVKPVQPPLPPKKSGLIASNKPLIFPRGVENKESKTKELGEEGIKENNVQMKLKPLHWEKVTANADHSMVWNDINNGSFREPETAVPRIEFRQHGTGAIKGVIVDEEGLNMLFVRKLEEGQQFPGCFSNKGWYNPMDEEVKKMNPSKEDKPIQEIPLLQEPMRHEYEVEVKKPLTVNQDPLPPPPLPPPPCPTKVKPVPPPLPPKKSGLITSNKPPIFPRGTENSESNTKEPGEESIKENSVQMKLKPLHWDKVTANADHSMVWNDINNGSFRFDDDLMETLFGYTTNTQKSTTDKSYRSSSHHVNSNSLPSAQIFLLDPRKSQNTAIVLKSLSSSRKEITDALLEGRGLNTDTLEKLTKICPTQDDITKILNFNGNPTKLADAESFLYHILKAVPSAFIRFNAMLFRSTYDSDILHLKQSLQTLEHGCEELRTCRVFYKLLEAILKAGNRLNAGTNRGNARGFNLNALRRLSDVKSADGKSTLLHFVVEQVVRSEGKRFSFNGDDYCEEKGDFISDIKNSKKEKDTEHVMLGLKVLESLNTDFVNVKKAASIDCDNLISMCLILTRKADEIKGLLRICEDIIEQGGFLREMKGFLEDCEKELEVVRDEEKRVMEIVRKTTAYYQAKDKLGINCLQLFVIVTEFLKNVDQVCAEIGNKMKKEKVGTRCVAGSSPPLTPKLRSPVRFQNLEMYFRAQRGNRSSSDDDSGDDFS